MKAQRRTALIKSIARGRAWLDEIVSGTASIEGIAARQKCSVRQVNMTISMAFIAPALVKAAVEGRLPRGIGIATLRDAPAEWFQTQHASCSTSSVDPARPSWQRATTRSPWLLNNAGIPRPTRALNRIGDSLPRV